MPIASFPCLGWTSFQRVAVLLAGLMSLVPCGKLWAASVALNPVADTTLVQLAANNNLGGNDFFNAGTAGNGRSSRALLKFDPAGAIPPGSTILSARLTLEVIREPAAGSEFSPFPLHRVLRPWGEGNKVSEPSGLGLGLPATVGEATWLDRFAFSASPWSAPGGAFGVDFAAVASGEQFIEGMSRSPYTFDSTSAMVGDLQFWLLHPESNFGWMLLSESEGVPHTALGFGSREGGFPPQLDVDYVPVPEPGTWALLGLGAVAWLARRRFGRHS